MKWTVNLRPCSLPNFLTFDCPVPTTESSPPQIDAGELTDDQAKEYWAWMERKWLAHVVSRRGGLAKEKRVTNEAILKRATQ